MEFEGVHSFNEGTQSRAQKIHFRPRTRIYDKFTQKIVETVTDSAKFVQSEKAIAMLTTASLVLKKMPKEEQK